MRCRNIELQLPDYVGGTIGPNERAVIDEHLAGCPRCLQAVRDIEIALDAAKQDTPSEPSHTYWTSLLPRIHERIEKRSTVYTAAPIARFLAPVAAAVVVVALAIWYVPTMMHTSQQPSATSELVQVPQSELQDYVEQQSVVGIAEPVVRTATVSSDDKALLKELLQNESRTVSYVSEASDDESILDAVPAQDADRLLAILEKNPSTKSNY